MPQRLEKGVIMSNVKFIIDKRTPESGKRRIYRDMKRMIDRFARTGNPEKPQYISLNIDECKNRVKIDGLTDEQGIEIMDTFATAGSCTKFVIKYM